MQVFFPGDIPRAGVRFAGPGSSQPAATGKHEERCICGRAGGASGCHTDRSLPGAVCACTWDHALYLCVLGTFPFFCNCSNRYGFGLVLSHQYHFFVF